MNAFLFAIDSATMPNIKIAQGQFGQSGSLVIEIFY